MQSFAPEMGEHQKWLPCYLGGNRDGDSFVGIHSLAVTLGMVAMVDVTRKRDGI